MTPDYDLIARMLEDYADMDLAPAVFSVADVRAQITALRAPPTTLRMVHRDELRGSEAIQRQYAAGGVAPVCRHRHLRLIRKPSETPMHICGNCKQQFTEAQAHEIAMRWGARE